MKRRGSECARRGRLGMCHAKHGGAGVHMGGDLLLDTRVRVLGEVRVGVGRRLRRPASGGLLLLRRCRKRWHWLLGMGVGMPAGRPGLR